MWKSTRDIAASAKKTQLYIQPTKWVGNTWWCLMYVNCTWGIIGRDVLHRPWHVQTIIHGTTCRISPLNYMVEKNVPTKQICQFHAEHFVHLCTIIFCPLIFLVGAVAMSSLWIFAWFQAAKWMVRNFGKTCWMNLEYGVSFHHLHFHAPLHHLYITPLCFERAQVPIADCRFVIYNMVRLPCF